uniref:Si:ch211-262h13.5 n=1 Tax=Erpetoichthys calabaricus TaxID=27687 RepID=A0A8C4S5A5_ERPCA
MAATTAVLFLFLCTHFVICWTHGTGVVPAPCNSRSVERAARLAVTYINEDRKEGYKFSLNRINNVYVHEQEPVGKVHYLDIDVLETKCYIKSTTAWEDCEIRPFTETKVSGRCKTIVYSKPNGSSVLYNYDCNLIPDQPEAVHHVCPECPLLIDVKSPAAIQAAGISLKKYNEESHLRNYFSIDQITRASTQNKPKEAYFVEFTIQETECLKQDESVDDLKCRKTSSDSGQSGFCAAALHKNGDNQAVPEISCELYTSEGIGNAENKGNVTNDGQEADTQRGKRRDKQHKVQSPKFTHLKATPTSVQDLQPESSESKSDSKEQEGILPVEASASAPLPVTSKRLKRQSSPEGAASLPKTGPVFLTNFPEAPSRIHTCPGVFRHVTL